MQCGGYKKDFKWKSFEENTFVGGSLPKRTKKGASTSRLADVTFLTQEEVAPKTSPVRLLEVEPDTQELRGPSIVSDAPAEQPPAIAPVLLHTELPSDAFPIIDASFPESPAFDAAFDDTCNFNPLSQDFHMEHALLNQDSAAPTDPADSVPAEADDEDDEDYEDVEEIDRGSQPFVWAIKQRHINAIYANQRELVIANNRYPLHRTITFQPDSQESLMHTYISQTSGILSIKDGPTENPWRTLIYPLAQSSPPLYHALASMTAFHLASSANSASKYAPSPHSFRLLAVRHLSTSLTALSTSLSSSYLPAQELLTDLATTLTLAFAESWDWGTRSGISHLRGSRILVSRALTVHASFPYQGEDFERLKFLANCWMYLDVLAQLTSMCDIYCAVDFEALLAPLGRRTMFGPLPRPGRDGGMAEHLGKLELDPLLGCSSTLFPILARVATLLKRVRVYHLRTGMLDAPLPEYLMEPATNIKANLETWDPGDVSTYSEPEDDPSSVRYGLATAETYRLVTLMLLYQAVPSLAEGGDMITTVNQLAESAMALLDSTPISSRVVIIQIFPLMLAGCEAKSTSGFREWVRERWKGMKGRMWIGNLECCSSVVEELWKRRDQYEAMGMARRRDYAVGGRLHWATVMREWKWEGECSANCRKSVSLTLRSASGIAILLNRVSTHDKRRYIYPSVRLSPLIDPNQHDTQK